MDSKETLISQIMAIEWDMFTSVQNRGGRASCQDDPTGFEIIRTSNFSTWSETTLRSYLSDLEAARDEGRNLMTEKYARMEGLLPPPDSETLQLIDQIVDAECEWVEALQQKYPDVKMARPVRSSQDMPGVVSSETYSRGELATYSKQTLQAYLQDNIDMLSQGLNRIEIATRRMAVRFSELQSRNQ